MELFSGIIGVLIGIIITSYHQYLSDQWKWRTNIILEVVAYCDDIYDHLQFLHVTKAKVMQDKHQNEAFLDDYHDRSQKLSTLLKNSLPRVKIRLIYGEGNMLGDFNRLWSCFLKVTSTLRKATKVDWEKVNEEIMLIYSQTIDPLRESLESKLLEDTEKYTLNNKLVTFKNSILLWLKAVRKYLPKIRHL